MTATAELPARVPDSWNRLVDGVQEVMISDAPKSEQEPAVQLVWRLSREMTGNEYDRNRFHGLEIATACLMQSIRRGKQEDVIRGATSSFRGVHQHDSYSERPTGSGLYIADLRPHQGMLYAGFGRDQYREVDMAVRIVADTLDACAPNNINPEPMRDLTLKSIFTRDIALETSAGQALTAITGVAKATLIKRYERSHGKTYNWRDFVLVRDVATIEQLRQLRLTRAAVMLSRLRKDEFTGTMGLVELDDDGMLYVDHLPDKSDLIRPGFNDFNLFPLGHTDRIGCPARRVPGAIIDVSKWMPEILARTQESLTKPSS